MALTEDQTRVLWLYHDYLRSAGLVVCERVAQPEQGVHLMVSYHAVRGSGKELIEGFARSREATGDGRRATEEQEQEQETDALGHRLHQTMDAKEWAHAFMRIIIDPGVPIDEGLMIGWFSGAIMTGWDFSARGRQEEQERG